ncbi:MAG TPA: SRPBCC domain-containing protein [Microthrixaceae bacterium]|nr:SRPBCC domain-containing protein [Microthrixaceae bacterium]
MTDPIDTNDAIRVDQFIPSDPARVWRALTTPDELAKWWVPGNIAPVVGHEFLLEMPGWGNVACTVLEVDEPERLAFTFADWTLTWRLVPEGNGTRLFLDHTGFDLDNPQHRFAIDQMGPGWRDHILPALAGLMVSDG